MFANREFEPKYIIIYIYIYTHTCSYAYTIQFLYTLQTGHQIGTCFHSASFLFRLKWADSLLPYGSHRQRCVVVQVLRNVKLTWSKFKTFSKQLSCDAGSMETFCPLTGQPQTPKTFRRFETMHLVLEIQRCGLRTFLKFLAANTEVSVRVPRHRMIFCKCALQWQLAKGARRAGLVNIVPTCPNDFDDRRPETVGKVSEPWFKFNTPIGFADCNKNASDFTTGRLILQTGATWSSHCTFGAEQCAEAGGDVNA